MIDSEIGFDKGSLQEQLSSWFAQWPFEFFVSLTLEDDHVSNEVFASRIVKWNRSLEKKRALQTAYQGLISYHNRKHAHLLLLGRNRFGNTLLPAWASGRGPWALEPLVPE